MKPQQSALAGGNRQQHREEYDQINKGRAFYLYKSQSQTVLSLESYRLKEK